MVGTEKSQQNNRPDDPNSRPDGHDQNPNMPQQ